MKLLERTLIDLFVFGLIVNIALLIHISWNTSQHAREVRFAPIQCEGKKLKIDLGNGNYKVIEIEKPAFMLEPVISDLHVNELFTTGLGKPIILEEL